jgi:magnesium transporter
MLKQLINEGNRDVLKLFLEDIHAFDLSELFVDLSDEEKQVVYEFLDPEKLAELVSYLDVEDAAEVLADFDIKQQIELVEMMEPDDAADIILELEDDEQKELLDALGTESDIVSLIRYEDDETGSAMTNLMVVLNPDMDVKPATKKVIIEASEVESINTLFVVDNQEIFLGIVPLKKLLKTKTPCDVKSITEESPFVYDTDPIEKTIQAIRNYAIYEMPVVNQDKKLIGMITLDDALDIYEEEAQEDFEKLAGLPETEPDLSPVKTALHRLPWLLSLLALSIPIAMVSSFFEETLAMVAILIVFQPLILDSAGNVATQTLAVTLKMFASHETGFWKNALREILTGMMNGFVIGLIAFAMTYILSIVNPSLTSNAILMSFIVGMSLWLTVILAPIVAIVIPATLKALKFDPAVASGPFITTLIDVGALVIYFGLATLLLGGML